MFRQQQGLLGDLVLNFDSSLWLKCLKQGQWMWGDFSRNHFCYDVRQAWHCTELAHNKLRKKLKTVEVCRKRKKKTVIYFFELSFQNHLKLFAVTGDVTEAVWIVCECACESGCVRVRAWVYVWESVRLRECTSERVYVWESVRLRESVCVWESLCVFERVCVWKRLCACECDWERVCVRMHVCSRLTAAHI